VKVNNNVEYNNIGIIISSVSHSKNLKNNLKFKVIHKSPIIILWTFWNFQTFWNVLGEKT
jgi:hypothetical protein